MGALDDLLSQQTKNTDTSIVAPKNTALDLLLEQSLAPGTATQQSGPVVSPSGLLQRLKPKKEDIPEIVGGTIGGLVTRNPYGIMAGSAAGASVGEGVRQLLGKTKILNTEVPKSFGESAKKLGSAALRGGMAGVAQLAVGKILTPFSKSVTPEIKTGLEAAKRAGVQPPLSATTESPVVQALERYSEVGPFGGGVTRQKQVAVKQLEDFTEKISNGISPDNPPELVGEMAKNKVIEFEKAFKSAKDKLYEPINAALKDKPVNPQNTIAAIEEVLDRRAGGKEGKAV